MVTLVDPFREFLHLHNIFIFVRRLLRTENYFVISTQFQLAAKMCSRFQPQRQIEKSLSSVDVSTGFAYLNCALNWL